MRSVFGKADPKGAKNDGASPQPASHHNRCMHFPSMIADHLAFVQRRIPQPVVGEVFSSGIPSQPEVLSSPKEVHPRLPWHGIE